MLHRVESFFITAPLAKHWSSHLVSREENPDRMPGVERMGLSARTLSWSDAVNFEDMHGNQQSWDLDRLLPLLAIVDTPVV
ncbi:hypothetical protein M378DRAFT_164350 [Amanita muscaria Koide BX008]|uniref:Uncharacterized protein n=1 Tax=Amanita muscaria (strain Koide BX008) TaxID=946122 RepID=A0A0C2SJX8_AMAMK|nr:hypothetical protein M378DRAFT_164350 [Amanita muscaria Koide BX008]